jgi:hypothetical protein
VAVRVQPAMINPTNDPTWWEKNAIPYNSPT